MTEQPTDAEAKASLDAIERSRLHVIDEIDLPRWYWWGLAIGWIALAVVTDQKNAWLTASATLAFGAIHASVSQRVIDGRHRSGQLTVRADVVGKRVVPLILLSLVGLAALTIAGALAASADGSRHPVTTASIVVAVLIVLGGPRLMAAVRHRAARATAAS